MNPDVAQNIEKSFRSRFSSDPVLIFSPGRINFIGEHTDYNEGFVLPAAIDKGIYLAVGKSNASRSTVLALDVNDHLEFSVNDIKPLKNAGWKNYVLGILDEIAKKGKQIENFNMAFGGDIPQGAGLSSSAALENAIVYGLNELFRLGFSKKEMIYISQGAEHNYVGVKCGIMDQYASMFGRKDMAILLDCQNLAASYVNINFEDYEILLINSNTTHSLAESEYNERRKVCEKIASLLNIDSLRDASLNDLLSIKDQTEVNDYQKALYVIQENKRVLQMVDAINDNNMKRLGQLLYASHLGIKEQFNISSEELDFLVDNAKDNHDVIGARMMGGGFAGCTINIVKKEGLQSFQNKIKKSYKEHFNSNCSFYMVNLSEGTRIIE